VETGTEKLEDKKRNRPEKKKVDEKGTKKMKKELRK
jgi:hypothetical protein